MDTSVRHSMEQRARKITAGVQFQRRFIEHSKTTTVRHGIFFAGRWTRLGRTR